jgi:hypothetical protein
MGGIAEEVPSQVGLTDSGLERLGQSMLIKVDGMDCFR